MLVASHDARAAQKGGKAAARKAFSTHLRRRKCAKLLLVLTFLLPSLLFFGLFVLLPVVQAMYYSLYHWNGLGPLVQFTGLKNYRLLLQDTVFLTAVKTNGIITLLSLVVQLPLSLGLAFVVVTRKLPGRTFYRLVFFLPYILSEVITGLIWSFIYDPSTGLVSAFWKAAHLGAVPPAFLGDPHTVLYAIFVVMCWKYFGFHFILYTAGLQNIPEEMVEAAHMDGATRWQTFRHVTLPLLGSTIRLSVFLSILGSLQYFDLVYVMSDGGPVHASETMATYLVHVGFQRLQLGYGSAVGVMMFLLCFVFSLVYQRWVMRQDAVGNVAQHI